MTHKSGWITGVQYQTGHTDHDLKTRRKRKLDDEDEASLNCRKRTRTECEQSESLQPYEEASRLWAKKKSRSSKSKSGKGKETHQVDKIKHELETLGNEPSREKYGSPGENRAQDNAMDLNRPKSYYADVEVETLAPRKLNIWVNFNDTTVKTLMFETAELSEQSKHLEFQITVVNRSSNTSRKFSFVRGIQQTNTLYCPFELNLGDQYEFQVDILKFSPVCGMFVPFLVKTGTYKQLFHSSELQQLLHKAQYFHASTEQSNCLPVQYLYRRKPFSYFQHIIHNRNGIMEVYMKDQHGDPFSPINGQLNGLFFGVRPVSIWGEIPNFSPFGDTGITVPPEVLLGGTHLYFADFYCTNGKGLHYVTLVATKPNTPADNFCKATLLPLSWYQNPFLMYVWYYSGFIFVCCEEPTVELFYTDNIDLNCQFIGWQYNLRLIGKGSSTPGGFPKRGCCRICNLN